jgi:hypothetical protein
MRRYFLGTIVLFVFSSGGGIITADQYVYDSHGRRNPFLPPAEGKGTVVDAGGGVIVDTAPFQK